MVEQEDWLAGKFRSTLYGKNALLRCALT